LTRALQCVVPANIRTVLTVRVLNPFADEVLVLGVLGVTLIVDVWRSETLEVHCVSEWLQGGIASAVRQTFEVQLVSLLVYKYVCYIHHDYSSTVHVVHPPDFILE